MAKYFLEYSVRGDECCDNHRETTFHECEVECPSKDEAFAYFEQNIADFGVQLISIQIEENEERYFARS